jgi:hypothetical protein
LGVTTHEVTYRGPSSFAVRAAALLADADGVELTSANRADGAGASEEEAVLVLTLQASDDALSAAVEAVRAELPAGATLE